MNKSLFSIIFCLTILQTVLSFHQTCSEHCLQCKRGVCTICKGGFKKAKEDNKCVVDEYYRHKVIGFLSVVAFIFIGGVSFVWILRRRTQVREKGFEKVFGDDGVRV